MIFYFYNQNFFITFFITFCIIECYTLTNFDFFVVVVVVFFMKAIQISTHHFQQICTDENS